MVLGVGGMAVLSACHRDAAVLTVTTTADTVDVDPGDGLCLDQSGQCSLRAAVMEANTSAGVNEIRLADGATYTLSIAGPDEDAAVSGDLDVTQGVDISGDATVDAAGLDRVFDLHLLAVDLVAIQGPDITGGVADDGAAVRINRGTVLLTDSNVTDNDASAGAPLSAGPTSNPSVLLSRTTFAGNTGTTAGAIDQRSGWLIAVESTFSGNEATDAGAVRLSGPTNTDLRFLTITANSGAAAFVRANTGVASAGSSVIAAQTNGVDCAGTITSLGHNLESGVTCGFVGASDQQTADPRLAPLGPAGSDQLVHTPLTDSPLIDAIPADACQSGQDSRHLPRPAGGRCDTGSVEVQVLDVSHGGDDVDTVLDGVCQDQGGASGDCSLRAALIEANARPGLDIVSIADDVEEVALTRSGAGEDAAADGDLDLTDDVIVRGAGTAVDAGDLDPDGDGPLTGDRVVHVLASVDARLEGLTVRGGSVSGDGGGVLVEGELVLDRSTVRVNRASGSGGGIAIASGGVGAVRSTIVSANTASAGGGLSTGAAVPIELSWSTVIYNTATAGVGGLSGPGAMFVTEGSVIGDQAAGDDCAAGSVVSMGFNSDSDGTCGLGAAGDLPASDPDLDEDYDPNDTSALVGAGGTGCPAVDRYERGRPQAGACEIGALEKPSNFVVNSTDDEPDADLADGGCTTATGQCTLRAAVQQANAIPGPKSVLLTDPGPYALTVVGDDDAAVAGDLDVTEDLKVFGPATVDASSLDPDGPGGLAGDRLFHARDGAKLELWDLVLTGGSPAGNGGGVLAEGPVVLARTTLEGNSAARGGGVHIAEGGAETLLAESVVQGNTAGSGGGVAADAPVRVHGSTITANSAASGAGIQLGSTGAATIWVSIVRDQAAGNGCSGAAFTSFGSNQASDATCGLTDPTDTIGGAVVDEKELRPLRTLAFQTAGETAIENPDSRDALDAVNGRIIRAFTAYGTDVPSLHAMADRDIAILHEQGFPTAVTDSGTLAGAQITHPLLARLAIDPVAQSHMGAVDDGNGGQVLASDLVLEMLRDYVDNARPACDFKGDWGSLNLSLADPWTPRGTENLAMYRRTTCMIGFYALRDVPGYDNPADPNRRHWQPWATMLGRWLSERAGNGLLEEVRSPVYSDNTLAGIYNLAVFPGDPDLSRVAKGFLDLYWHDLAHEFGSNTGVAAAAGTRAYQWDPDAPAPDAAGNLIGVGGRELLFPDEDDIWSFLWLYGWHDGPLTKSLSISLPMLQGATAEYRPQAISEQLANAPGRDLRYTSVRSTTGSGGVGERHQIVRQIVSNDDYSAGVTTYGPGTLHNGSASEAMYAKVTSNTVATDQLVFTGIAAVKPPSTNFADWWSMNGALAGDALIFGRDHKAQLPPASCPPPAIPYRNAAELWNLSDCDGNSRGMRVTLGPGAFRDNLVVPTDGSDWFFTRAGNTYAAIRFGNADVTMFDASHQLVGPGAPAGAVVELRIDDGADGTGAADIWSPIVVQLGQASDFTDFDDFVAQVTSPVDLGGTFVDRYRRDPLTGEVAYTTLDVDDGGAVLEMDRQESVGTLPRVDGIDVEVDPLLAYDSPYLTMPWGADLATLTGPDGTQVIVDISYPG